MTQGEAIELARKLAERNNWTWREPVRAVRSRRWFVGRSIWKVISNADSKGCNVTVEIDDISHETYRAAFSPR